MKNKKYHTVRTVPKSNRKTKNITLSEQFQNLTEKSKKQAKFICLTSICMTTHVPGLEHALQLNVAGILSFFYIVPVNK